MIREGHKREAVRLDELGERYVQAPRGFFARDCAASASA